MRTMHALIAFCCLGTVVLNTWAETRPTQPQLIERACSGSGQLAVLSGRAVAPLLGAPLHKLALFRVSESGMTPVAFQIDRKDEQDRYIIEEVTAANAGVATLDGNDELVVRTADAGIRLSGGERRRAELRELVELRLGNGAASKPGWIYASVSGQTSPSGTRHIQYDPGSDAVHSASYRAGFSRRLPFLVESFQWRLAASDGWSPDVIDTMKIRHRGKFLGFIPFRRTQRDYTSRLTGVKTGSLRVIRRTENRVRMVLGLKTPAVYIDYIMMPDGFVMDTIIDIPFDVGLFFSDIETLTTVDWTENAALPRLTVQGPQRQLAASVDGLMSSTERDFSLIQADRFSVTSALGAMRVKLDIPAGVPITPWLYLRDALAEADPPEHLTGQYGNVGFRTTGWERIDTEVNHVKFRVCLEAGS